MSLLKSGDYGACDFLVDFSSFSADEFKTMGSDNFLLIILVLLNVESYFKISLAVYSPVTFLRLYGFFLMNKGFDSDFDKLVLINFYSSSIFILA